MLLLKNWGAARPQILGSARVSRAGDGVSPSRTFQKPRSRRERLFWRGRQNQHARRARYPEIWLVLFAGCCSLLGRARAQDAFTPPETAELVVSATRIPTSEDETPASVTVITADDFSIHQTERIADALRSVPGMSVVQSG